MTGRNIASRLKSNLVFEILATVTYSVRKPIGIVGYVRDVIARSAL